MSNERPFSQTWMWISFAVYIVTELFLGGVIGEWVRGYKSMQLGFMLQGLLNLASYFLGGLIIGVISPGIRIYEPAVGAFLAVLTTMVITFFTPYSFIHFSTTKVLIGGGIAFLLAMSGARLGEKLTKQLD